VLVFLSQKTQRIKGAGQENKLLSGRNIAANDALIDDSVAVNKDEVANLRARQKLLSELGDEIPTSFFVFQDADAEYAAL
jgi:hypothetical protein